MMLLIFFILVSSLLNVNTYSSDSELTDSWDFEPKIWVPEEDKTPIELYDLANEETDDLESETESSSLKNWREFNNFLDPSKYVKIGLKATEKECDQFRVDIREAIVCDKKRCDKLDFEWPTFPNQIALIETTKHGMRFHRSDLAFASRNKDQLDIKDFDLLALFKPKPNSKPKTTSTTTTTTTTTVAPTTTVEPTTTISSSTNSTSDETTTNSSAKANPAAQDTSTNSIISTLRLDTKRIKQKMLGFGGALSDSACRNVKSLSPAMAKSLMEDYFGDRGLKYTMVRMSMGSSDFSSSPYTNNDLDNATSRESTDSLGDVEMKNFRLTNEDYEFKLPVARQAIATSSQELKFISSLWSPPVWMKNNSNIVHGWLKGDIFGPYYKGLAELMIKWLEAYKKSGIDIWATTGLNEPITGTKPFIFHNSLGITRDDYIIFLKLYLGPMLRQKGLQNIKLIILDDNKGYAPNWVKAALDDPQTSRYIYGVGIHWYMNDEYENLNFISKKYPDKVILSTEACNGFMPFQRHVLPGNWDRGVAYMHDIIKTIQKNVAAWIDWNMALNLNGGPNWAGNYVDAPIIVNAKRDEYYKSPTFYALGHFSRFVEPNSTRLDYILANARYDYPLEMVAFHTPKNYIVIVALNANKHQIPLRIIVDKQLVRIVTLRADSFTTMSFKWVGRQT